MKYLVLLLFFVACTIAPKPQPVPKETKASPKISKKASNTLTGWYSYMAYEEPEEPMPKSTAIEIRKDGTFSAFMRYLKSKNGKSFYDTDEIPGTWTFVDDTIEFKTEKALCKYTYSKTTTAENDPMTPIGKGFKRKFTDGADVDVEFCKYMFMSCKAGTCI